MDNKIICNLCYKPKAGVQTGLCEHCGRFGKTDREIAMGWWHSLTSDEERQKYCDIMYPERGHSSLTGREIEKLWENHSVYIGE